MQLKEGRGGESKENPGEWELFLSSWREEVWELVIKEETRLVRLLLLLLLFSQTDERPARWAPRCRDVILKPKLSCAGVPRVIWVHTQSGYGGSAVQYSTELWDWGMSGHSEEWLLHRNYYKFRKHFSPFLFLRSILDLPNINFAEMFPAPYRISGNSLIVVVILIIFIDNGRKYQRS